MIVGNQKPLSEIVSTISGFKKVLVMGCGTCVSVCLTGGDKEARTMAKSLTHVMGDDAPEFIVRTIERQCEKDWLEPFMKIPEGTDAILSLACGAGVQTLASVYKNLPVLPALNTTFLGAMDEPGVWNEKCVGCGDCVLAFTGGICPVARCSKKLFNGPCGGASHGKCEISPLLGRDVDCAWQLIIERMMALGKMDEYIKIRTAKDWMPESANGPRRLVKIEQTPYAPVADAEKP